MSAGAQVTTRAKRQDERRHACVLVQRLTFVASGNIAAGAGAAGAGSSAAGGAAGDTGSAGAGGGGGK